MRSRMVNSRVVLRSATAADTDTLQRIERDAAFAFASVSETAFCLGLPVRDAGEHAGAQNRGLALVCERDGGALGFLLAIPLDNRAHLLEIAILQSHQRLGAGRTLIEAFHHWGKTAGFTEATLTTFRNIPWNAPFYARLGYIVIDVGADRPELLTLIAEEKQAGFHHAPRVAMQKSLVGP